MDQEKQELARIYEKRFGGNEAYRKNVWKILIKSFFGPWIPAGANILDLGCGHGEFINHVEGKALWGMDLNPEAESRMERRVRFLHQSCATSWDLPPGSLDLIFTSNFFEHLPTKDHLKKTLEEAHRALKKGGRLIALGPNIKKIPGAYWDFWDHYLPLTELSLVEVGTLCGFSAERVWAATLPYSMSQGFQPPLLFLRVYLALPFLWKFFGKQFLVIFRK